MSDAKVMKTSLFVKRKNIARTRIRWGSLRPYTRRHDDTRKKRAQRGLTAVADASTLAVRFNRISPVSRIGRIAVWISTAAVMTARSGTPALTTTGGMTITGLSGAGTG